MTKISVQEMRSETATELRDRLFLLKKEQFNLRFRKASGELENTARIRQVRRDIARVKTLLGKSNNLSPRKDSVIVEKH